jgi:hypothetical protein
MSMLARVIMLLALTIALGVSAQEEARKPPPANAKVTIPSPESAASHATGPDKQSGKAAAPESTPDHFEPSEQVRADFDVSFPVDI